MEESTSQLVRRRFELELSQPSEGYAVIPSTSIAVIPEVKISRISVENHHNVPSVQLTITGLVPDLEYALESDTELGSEFVRNRSLIMNQSTFTEEAGNPSSAPQTFYRVVR